MQYTNSTQELYKLFEIKLPDIVHERNYIQSTAIVLDKKTYVTFVHYIAHCRTHT